MMQHAQKAMKYLNAAMKSDGKWEDFPDTTPGLSDQWVTAHTGLCILDSRLSLDDDTRSSIARACTFLKANQKPDGGWGYNGMIAADTDSTAHALLLLRMAGQPAPRKAYAFLLENRLPDGSFATYRTGGGSGWSCGHPDVTALAAQALYGVHLRDPRILRQTRECLEQYLRASPLPPSYWWRSPYYTALVCLRTCWTFGWEYPEEAVLEACLLGKTPDSPVDCALRLELLAKLAPENPATAEALAALLSCQEEDGSFRGGAILRIPPPHIYEPWSEEDAKMEHVADLCGVYTTAAALRSIGALWERTDASAR